MMRLEEFLSAFFGGEVNKRKLSPARFDIRAELFNFTDSFAAKSAAEMAQENEEDRAVL